MQQKAEFIQVNTVLIKAINIFKKKKQGKNFKDYEIKIIEVQLMDAKC